MLYNPWGHKKSDMTEQLNTHTRIRYFGTPAKGPPGLGLDEVVRRDTGVTRATCLWRKEGRLLGNRVINPTTR